MYVSAHSYYSMRFGTMSPEELLKEAATRGVKTMALTDVNTTAASIQFVRLAAGHGIKPVLGIDFRTGARQHYIGIAKNNLGFYELNRFLSEHWENKMPFPNRAPHFEHAYIIYPFNAVNFSKLARHEFIGVRPLELNKLKFSPWSHHPEKLLALQPATFRHKQDYNTHRLLRAIDNNCLLSKLPPEDTANPNDFILSPETIKKLYKEFPVLIKNTHQLLEQTEIAFDFGSNTGINKHSYTGSASEDYALLNKLCLEGLNYRYPFPNTKIFDRLDKELKIIREKNFITYFLNNWDIVSYAQKKNYFYVGRGSGANSIVAYLLRITNVDPIDLDLYFERFINLYRSSPPDFDLDFSWKDREDITRYIFEKFPTATLLATYNTFQYKGVVRELGKVFGLPPHEIDRLGHGKYEYQQLDHLNKLVVKYGAAIHNFPNYLGIHAGGILIPEKPIHNYTATFLPPKGFATTHFDMIVAEDIGFSKYDILSQRGLGKIKEGIEIVKKNNPNAPEIDIHDIARIKHDKKVKALVKDARAMGCFYVESPAMRMLLKKLEVDDYLGLVAASSIIRPGVARSGMMREYILRCKNPERLKTAHPVMLDIMPDTYGVMVYQEDVIKVAYHFAGLTLAEADVLRRGMSGKFRSRSEFVQVEKKFFENCKARGYSQQITQLVWKQIESFAGYAFAKGHSASYAVESFQSLYLKAYYPLEFMVAVINNFGGFYRTEFYVHEARKNGARIHAPCVNKSGMLAEIYGKDIYLGFVHIAGFEETLAARIIQERKNSGPFKSFYDFIDRVDIGIEQLSLLIRINAFRFSGKPKREILWMAHIEQHKPTASCEQLSLFQPEHKEFKIPRLSQSEYEDAFDQMELLGFSLYSPFMLIKNDPGSKRGAQDLRNYLGREICIWGYLVTYKTTITVKRDRMNFGTFIDQNGDFFDTTHFPDVSKKYPFRGRGVYAVTGIVVEEFGFYSIEVSQMHKEDLLEDPRYSEKEVSPEKVKRDRKHLQAS